MTLLESRGRKLLKIAIATSFPTDPESPEGGVEAVSVNLCRALTALDDLEIHVVTFVPGPDRWGRALPGASKCASASCGIGIPAPQCDRPLAAADRGVSP